MASYYDEHNCPELAEGETPGPLLLARMLHDLGLTDSPDSLTPPEFNLDNEFRRLFGDDTRPPPASKEFIANLPDCELMLRPDAKCAICLGKMVKEDVVKDIEQLNISDDSKKQDTKNGVVTKEDRIVSLPCKHSFHRACIVMWISKVSTCPLCKDNLPTDDVLWEEYIKQVKLEQKQKKNFKNVQYSMYA